MLRIKRLVQITFFLLALLGSALLGMGLESSRLIMIAFLGASIGFIVTDLLKLFRIDGVLANIASVVILFLAMKDFFSEDSTGKLVSVANLLVYLQTVLMFQEKTPRLNWQILVLSLLQVVVGTIFTLDLEAGMLFLVYFLVAGAAMVLQSIYTDAVEVEKLNKRLANRLARVSGRANDRPAPVLMFDPADANRSQLRSVAAHLSVWMFVATTFTMVMFYLVPRHTKPWYGPANIEVTSTGVSKSVDLDERGLISLSNQLIFRVNFTDVSSGEPIEIGGNAPYFRGLALSNLVIEDGKTNWHAPHDRVNKDLYQRLPRFPATGIPIYQNFTMEETIDPLLYGVMPFFQTSETPDEITFCHELSAVTRCQVNDVIDMSPYKYQAGTIVDRDGRFARSWPYISNTHRFSENPMADDPPQYEWLTQLNPTRYPALVGIADRLAQENKEAGGDRLDLFRRMEEFLLDPGRFTYTLDFRNVRRDDRIDPIEDFVRNHRSGHCELFASSLTLMLRQQGIPARLVVGFYGSEQNNLTGGYMVRAKHAHAWVEAYLRPGDCSQEMKDKGQAGPGGAWMILDPTPLSVDRGVANIGDDAMDLARTVWDDYVLGMESQQNADSSAMTIPIFRFLRFLDVERLESEFNRQARFVKSPLFKYIVMFVVGSVMFLMWLRAVRRNGKTRRRLKKPGRFRRLIADALSLISPGLGAWMIEGAVSRSPTAFYQKMLDLLATVSLERRPSQTHREFALEVAGHFQAHPSASLIESTVREITEIYNEVRFGEVELPLELKSQIEMSLDELELAVAAPVEKQRSS